MAWRLQFQIIPERGSPRPCTMIVVIGGTNRFEIQFKSRKEREFVRSVFFTSLLALLCTGGSSSASTYYVNNSCSTAGNGTTPTCGSNGPFRTIAAGIAAARAAGDVVRVKYTGQDYSEASGIATAAAGTSSNPITLTCYVGDTVKPRWKRSSGTQFTISHQWWVVDSLDFWGNDVNSAMIRVNSPNVTIQHCRLHRNTGHGVSIGDGANNFKLQWCYLDSLGAGGDRHNLTTGHSGADPFAYTITGLQILNNTFRDSGGDCIQFFEDEIGTPCRSATVTGLIQYNAFIRGNRDPLTENAIDIKATALATSPMKIYNNTFYGWDGTGNPGKTITEQHCAEYIWVEGNIFQKGNGGGTCNPCLGVQYQADNTGTGVGCRGMRIVRNTFVGFKQGMQLSGKIDSVYVLNNTADALIGPMIRVEGTVVKGIFRNNLSQGEVLQCAGSPNLDGVVADHNGWFGTSTDQASCAESPCNLCDPTDIVGTDPKWVNPAGLNFNLATGSTAINAGVNVGLPFIGLAPDLGAWESGINPLDTTPPARAFLQAR